jgi:sialic acid synthase SpsE
MSQIILDMGSGNTCRNDIDYAKRMIDTVIEMDKKHHEIIFKWQLEKKDPEGQKKLDHSVFTAAFEYAKEKGYKTTSSVFDYESLMFLLQFPSLPFIKIPCRPDIYYLAGGIPRAIPVYLSAYREQGEFKVFGPVHLMLCVPHYPAKLEDYEKAGWCGAVISDHTPGLDLWRKYQPQIWEKHFILERSPDNPDSGVFAITSDELREVIG